MTYACTVREFAADSHLLKLLRLQNNVLRATGNFPRRTSVRDLHMTFKLLYVLVYNYVCSGAAVSRWRPTEAARVRARVRSCGICGRQSGTGAGMPLEQN
jgi:hypothetical protein